MTLKDKNRQGKNTEKSWKPTTTQNITPQMKVILNKHKICREKNLNNRQYIDANKLANVRRHNIELSQIEDAAKNVRPERNVEPVIRVENLDNEEIEVMIN